VLFVDSSDKVARFVWLCDAFNIPLVFLSDVPGFMIGSAVERQGIIRHGAKLITAVSEATVPKICVVVRKAYGAGLYAMAGPGFEPDATLALPTARIAVMGPEPAVNAVFYNKIQAISDPVERAAFVAEQAAQCGYCTNGMIMTTAALLAKTPRPTEAQARQALAQAEGSLRRLYEGWRSQLLSAQALIEARSEDAVKAEVINDIIPVPGTVGYGTVGRTLRTPFLDEWGMKRDEARRNGARLWAEIGERLRRGQRRETLVCAGQTAGGVREILTVAEIMRQLVDQTETALARAPGLQ